MRQFLVKIGLNCRQKNVWTASSRSKASIKLFYELHWVFFVKTAYIQKSVAFRVECSKKKYYCSWPQLEVALECKKNLTTVEGLLVDLLSMTNVIILTIRPTTNIKWHVIWSETLNCNRTLNRILFSQVFTFANSHRLCFLSLNLTGFAIVIQIYFVG